MIEWIIFIAIIIISSEILFFKFGSSDEWLSHKAISLTFGIFISVILFGLPYSLAYECNVYPIAEDCVNHGAQVFFWFYGIIIGVVLFFWINKIILQKMEAKKDEKKENTDW